MPSKFMPGEIAGVVTRPLITHRDQRGWLIELFREDELEACSLPVMAYVSGTAPGQQRGPHEHIDQTDYFAFCGPGDFLIRLWDARPGSPTLGAVMTLTAGESNPLALVVPPGVVHGYRNIGFRTAWMFNAPDRLYGGPGKQEAVDEIRHEGDPHSPYRFD